MNPLWRDVLHLVVERVPSVIGCTCCVLLCEGCCGLISSWHWYWLWQAVCVCVCSQALLSIQFSAIKFYLYITFNNVRNLFLLGF